MVNLWGVTLLVLSTADFVLATFLLLHGKFDHASIAVAFSGYDVVSPLDLWVVCWVRLIFMCCLLSMEACRAVTRRYAHPSLAPDLLSLLTCVDLSFLVLELDVWMNLFFMLFTTGLLFKLAFFACFLELMPPDQGWSWALLAQSAVFMLAEFLAARRYLKQSRHLGRGDANSSDGGYSLIPQEEVGQSPGSCFNLEVDAGKAGSPKEEEGVTLSSHKRILWRLFGLAMQEWSYLALGLVFLVAASISQALLPRLTGDVINSIVIDKSEEDMEEALRSLTLFSLLCSLFSGLRGTCFLVVNTKMNIRIRKDLYQSMLKQEIGFFDQNKVGDLTSR